MRSVRVSLGSRSYDIIVGVGLIGSLSQCLSHLKGSEKVAIVTDSNVESLYALAVEKQLDGIARAQRLVVDAGERSKSWHVAGRLLEDLAALGLGRHDFIVTVGGGMVSDLGGFLASVYMRGIAVVHVPTTLLGQVDAAIGGKTGVNLTAGKNLAGTFYQPAAVVCDVETLLSLPEPEFRSGMAEVIKYGLCFEPEILGYFGEARVGRGSSTLSSAGPGTTRAAKLTDPAVLEDIVFRCAAIKAGVVGGDETDRSGRIMLNYGHTLGHALEAAGGFSRWSHGEAISVGMMFAANLAGRMGLLDERIVELHRRVLGAAGLPVRAEFDPGNVARLWTMDKKREQTQRWVLLEDLGKPVVRSDPRKDQIESALQAVLT